jgi:uncharacterized protein YkwD
MGKTTRMALAFGLAFATTSPGLAWDGIRLPFLRLADRSPRTITYRVPAHTYGGYASTYSYAAPSATQRTAYYDYDNDAPPAVEASAYDAQPAAAPAASYAYGDPYGFLNILNNYRASMGLQPVAFDPNLTAWASQNNAVQSRRGIGHHVNPNCFQNCGWNHSSAWGVFQGWLDSPGHRRNMLSPSITRVGIAYGPGPYWTLNAR